MTEEKIPIAHLSQFARENPLAIEIEGLDLVAVLYDDAVTVFEGRCPHQGTLRSLDSNELVCRSHGWRFNYLSGDSTGRPGVSLKTLPVEIEAGQWTAYPGRNYRCPVDPSRGPAAGHLPGA